MIPGDTRYVNPFLGSLITFQQKTTGGLLKSPFYSEILRFLERKLGKELCTAALWLVGVCCKLEFTAEIVSPRGGGRGMFRPAGRGSFQTIGKNPKDRQGPRPSGLRFRLRFT